MKKLFSECRNEAKKYREVVEDYNHLDRRESVPSESKCPV
jgi:hypothetical protein